MFATAGSVILWDNRLPHGTATSHRGPDTREVLFMTYLPDIPRNKSYAMKQLTNYNKGRLPPDFCRHQEEALPESPHCFSALGRKLMAIDEWLPDDSLEELSQRFSKV